MIPGRDARGEDAVTLDTHLDDLLSGHPRPTAPDEEPATPLDPDLARAARAVANALSRFHPSFRFEERLAQRLREEAVPASRPPLAAEGTGPGVVIPFAPREAPSRLRSRRVNGALIGGAISAGVSLASLAGAAIMARRRARSDSRWERVV
jgi:hypothetical protein